jgi:hypothetical protein
MKFDINTEDEYNAHVAAHNSFIANRYSKGLWKIWMQYFMIHLNISEVHFPEPIRSFILALLQKKNSNHVFERILHAIFLGNCQLRADNIKG